MQTEMRYPRPLSRGDTVAITAPSAGVQANYRARLQFATEHLKARGFSVMLGRCVFTDDPLISAAPQARAEELQDFLLDPSVRAVVPPWGGRVAIDILEHLDWEALAAAEPTWVVGYSDISTVLTPYTVLTGIATIHGNNLMETPYVTPEGMFDWIDISGLPAGESFKQQPLRRYREDGRDDFAQHPDVTRESYTGVGTWRSLTASGSIEATGRLFGGCLETVANVIGGPYCPVDRVHALAGDDGSIVYLETAGADAAVVMRTLVGLRHRGLFESANAVLIGRTNAPAFGDLTHDDAVSQALGPLDVPIIADVDCGHVAPHMPLVNGALANLRYDRVTQTLRQSLL